MAEARTNRRLAAILAADVVGYSRMMASDEAGTLAALGRLEDTEGAASAPGVSVSGFGQTGPERDRPAMDPCCRPSGPRRRGREVVLPARDAAHIFLPL